ncbi:MAG TPA: restriction endonuclease subunit S [Actinomycetota bacterium]
MASGRAMETAARRRFRPYDNYSPARVAFIDVLPAHWKSSRLKMVADVRLSNVDKKSVAGEPPVRLCNYTDVYYNEKITEAIEFMPATATDDQVARFGLRKGDVLITKDSESWSDIAVPAVVMEDLEGVLCGYHLAQVRPGPWVEGRFLARAFASEGIRDQFFVAANGITRYGLSVDDIVSAWFPVPPLDEQAAIADFLDRETAKIDVLIAEKQRLIDLLQEKRTALITRAVTKGIDSSVPMKDSGIDWLGEIPSHWDAKPLRLLARPGYKTFTDGDWIEAPFIRSDGIRLIQTGNIGVGRYKEQGYRYIDEETFSSLRCTEVEPGDVLICRLADPVGRACLTPTLGVRMITSVDVCILKHAKQSVGPFIVYALSNPNYLSWMGAICRGGTRDRVSRSMLGSIRVQVPPVEEQQEIVDYLNQQTAGIDSLISRILNGISSLEEHRTALISAAVTGKIDVQAEGVA